MKWKSFGSNSDVYSTKQLSKKVVSAHFSVGIIPETVSSEKINKKILRTLTFEEVHFFIGKSV